MKSLLHPVCYAMLLTCPAVRALEVPNSRFDVVGALGDTVISFPATPVGPAAAAGWTQSLLTGTHLATQVGLSTGAVAHPGGCGNVFTIITDSPGNGSGGSTVTLNLPADVPRGTTGYMDIRIVSGSVRYGFLINQGGSTVFDGNNIREVSDHAPWPGGWARVQFRNLTAAAGAIAVQVYAVPGEEARVEIDNVAINPRLYRTGHYDFPGAFGPVTNRGTDVCLSGETPVLGDFNGDGLTDVASLVRSSVSGPNEGDVWVSLNTGHNTFAAAQRWHDSFCTGSEIPRAGDFDGDGRDDLVSFVVATGKVQVVRSTGTAFGVASEWYSHGIFQTAGSRIPAVGDFDGDGRDDIVSFGRDAILEVWVALSDGVCFGQGHDWESTGGAFCPGTSVPCVGDVDGDGRDDIVCFRRDSQFDTIGEVRMEFSEGNRFSGSGSFLAHDNFAPSSAYEPFLADVNGDGCADLLAVHDDGRVFAAVWTARYDTAMKFGTGNDAVNGDAHWQWHPGVRHPGELLLAGRCNRDRNDDLFVFPRGLRPGVDASAVLVSLCGGHAEPEPDARLAEFGYGTMGAGSGPVVRPLLVLVAECAGSPLSRTIAQYEQGIFGPAAPNVKGWFSEMSHGVFTFSRAGLFKIGPYACPLPELTSVRTQLEDAANADGTGGFEFKNYDTDGDGTVETSELALLGISSFYHSGGQTFGVDTVIFPGTPRQVRVALKWSYAGDGETLGTMAHELCHGACGMADLYGSNCRGFGLTLATCTAGATIPTDLVHLDAWHKIRMGWVRPLIYDLKDFPAGAALRPAQASDARPVILYDSSRGTQEFHILEHRNGNYENGTATWTAPGGTWRAAGRTSWPAAGYDMDVRDTSGNRAGFLTWSVKTDAAHNVLDIVQRIGPGPNNTLNSAVLGDDIAWPLPGTPSQIHCGPDGILQSVTAGDDVFWQDALCLPIPNPADMLVREISSLNPGGEAATTLRYYNSSDTGVTVRGADVNGDTWQFLEWGKTFRPFMESVTVPPAPLRPGDRIIVLGSLGQQGRFFPKLISPEGQLTTLDVESWTGAGAVLRIPSAGRSWPGENRLVIFDGNIFNRPSSNAFTVIVADPCQLWLEEHFTAAERANPALSGDDADPDMDGWSNIAEMILNTDPRRFNEPLLPGDVRSDDSFSFPFVVRRDSCDVLITLQTSTDLHDWTNADSYLAPGTTGSGGPIFLWLNAPPISGSRAYFRVTFKRM